MSLDRPILVYLDDGRLIGWVWPASPLVATSNDGPPVP